MGPRGLGPGATRVEQAPPRAHACLPASVLSQATGHSTASGTTLAGTAARGNQDLHRAEDLIRGVHIEPLGVELAPDPAV